MSVDGYGHSASHGALTGLDINDHTQYNLRESLPARHFTNSEPMTSYPMGRSMFECNKNDGFPQYGLLVTLRNSVNIYHSHQMILEGISWTQMVIYQRRWQNVSGGSWTSWHLTAGAEPWVAVPLANSWVNYGGSWANGAYRKAAGGIVELRGLIDGRNSTSVIMFTLPAGYRPAANNEQMFRVSAEDGTGATAGARVDVQSSGVVRWTSGPDSTPAFLSLNGIRFEAEQ